MNYLLDSHYLLWSILNTRKISKNIKQVIADVENNILISTVSLWEISLKFSLGKMNLENILPEELPYRCEQLDFKIIELSQKESSTFYQLPRLHKDPFDRMLIWQAIQNDYTFISVDPNVKHYQAMGLKLFI